MKLYLTFKTPDIIFETIREIRSENENLSEEELSDIEDSLSKWIRYGECVTICFDTETTTAVVKEA